VAVATGTNTAIPLSVFSAGSGVYLLNVDSSGNNDVQAFGSIIISPAGTLVLAVGFTAFNVSPTGAVVGAVSTNPYQGVFLLGKPGAPTLFQNVAASLTYSVIATKIANL
jgi:hypothetical protein